MRAYQNDEDIHTLTASEVFGVPAETMDKETRARAKAVNFGIVYGISPFGLAAQLGIPQAEARAYIDRYFARYQGVQTFIEKTLEATRREGSVRTLFGRIRPIPDIESRNANQRGFAERTAINTPLQGTAADLIKLAMIALDRKLASANLKPVWCFRFTTNCSLKFLSTKLLKSKHSSAARWKASFNSTSLSLPTWHSAPTGAI